MALPKALRYAVLHVGSSSMSITILEYKGIDDVRVIDYAAREVTFGEELFSVSFKVSEFMEPYIEDLEKGNSTFRVDNKEEYIA